MNGLNGTGVYNPYAELMKGFNSIDAATLAVFCEERPEGKKLDYPEPSWGNSG